MKLIHVAFMSCVPSLTCLPTHFECLVDPHSSQNTSGMPDFLVELFLETSHINSLAMAQLSPMNMKNFPKLAGVQQTHTSHAMALNWPRALVISHSLHPARPTCDAMNLRISGICGQMTF